MKIASRTTTRPSESKLRAMPVLWLFIPGDFSRGHRVFHL